MDKMEKIEQLHKEIQAAVNELIKSPDSKEKLEELQKQLQQDWAEYQQLAKEIRPTLTDQEDINSLNASISRALKTVNIAEQGIANKLQKLNEDTKGLSMDSKEAQEPSTSTLKAEAQPTNQEKVSEGPLKVDTTDTGLKNPDIHALHALLVQITNQFNDIAHGKYPAPATDTDGPLVGDGQQESEGDVASPTRHRASAVTRRPEALSRHPAQAENPAPAPPPLPAPQPAPAPAGTGACDAIQQPTIELKMDRFTLPTFDGDLTNWLSFRDQFTDLIHKNPKYTPITKFIQLRGHSKGTALEAIKGFGLSAASYDAAWYIIQRRYNKPDQIIDEHLRKLNDLPVIGTPTAQKLITMVNCTNQILRVLPSLGVNVSNWDAIIKYSLTSKLDRTTHKKWLDQIKLRQNVPLNELIEFLEIEASENLPGPSRGQPAPEQRRPNRFRQKPAAVLTTVAGKESPPGGKAGNTPRCPQCNGMHELYLCGTFKKLSVKDRIGKMKGFKICFRCLRKHEHPADCKFGMCPTCQKDHNSLLCYQREGQKKEATPHVGSLHPASE